VPVYVDDAATEVITREAYFELERRLQLFRLRVVRLAAMLARAENSHGDLNRHFVHAALRRFASEGLNWNPPTSNEPVSTFPQEAFMYLEKRIHNLRILLTQWATRFAREDAKGDSQVFVTPQHVSQAWERVGQSTSVLRSALLENAGRDSSI
jgi:hypothetical protein